MAKPKKSSFKISNTNLWAGVENIANFLTIFGFFVATYFAWLSVQNQEEISSLKEIALNTGKNEEKITASLDSFGVIIGELRRENESLAKQVNHLSQIDQNSQKQLSTSREQFKQYVESTKPKLIFSEFNYENASSDSTQFLYEITNFGDRPAKIQKGFVVWCLLTKTKNYQALLTSSWLGNFNINPQENYVLTHLAKNELVNDSQEVFVWMKLTYSDTSVDKTDTADIYFKWSPSYGPHSHLDKSEKESFQKFLSEKNVFSVEFSKNLKRN